MTHHRSLAVAEAQKALSLAPQDAELHLTLGSAIAATSVKKWDGNTDWRFLHWLHGPEGSVDPVPEAVEALSTAVRLRPAWPRAHALLAVLCSFWPMHDQFRARQHLKLALDLDPNEEVALLASAVIAGEAMPDLHSCIGRCNDASQDDDAAPVRRYRAAIGDTVVDFLRRVVEIAPTHAEARAALGAQLTGSADAVLELRHAVALAPQSRPLVDFVARELRYFRHGRDERELIDVAVSNGLWRLAEQRPLTYWRSVPTSVFPKSFNLQRAIDVVVRTWPDLAIELQKARRSNVLQFFDGFRSCGAGSVCRREDPGILPTRTLYAGYWQEAHIYSADHPGMAWADWHPEQCTSSHTPLTCNALAQVAKLSGLKLLRASISVVHGPRTYIPKHHETTQGRLRLHCPLEVPDGAKSLLRVGANDSVLHKEGECFWFDESVGHDLVYTSPSGKARALFMVDAVNPELLSAGSPEVQFGLPNAAYWAEHYFSNSTGKSPQLIYRSSALEESWLIHVSNWTSDPRHACANLPSDVAEKWVDAIALGSSLSSDLFSAFLPPGLNSEPQWIEPLAQFLRHPAFSCKRWWSGGSLRKIRPWPWGDLIEDRSYMLLSAANWADTGRRILFDAGVALFDSSMGWFLDEYHRKGIDFDLVFGWETRSEFIDRFWFDVPEKIRASGLITFYPRGVTKERGHEDNPVHRVMSICRPEDFCVLKLDVDNPRLERALISQLIEHGGPASLGLLDELFWEDEVLGPIHGYESGSNDAEGTYVDSYGRFQELRYMGVRAHAWI